MSAITSICPLYRAYKRVTVQSHMASTDLRSRNISRPYTNRRVEATAPLDALLRGKLVGLGPELVNELTKPFLEAANLASSQNPMKTIAF